MSKSAKTPTRSPKDSDTNKDDYKHENVNKDEHTDNKAGHNNRSDDKKQLLKPTSIDYFLSQFGKFADKSLFMERGIKLVQWTFWLVSKLTKNHQRLPKDLSPSLRKVYSDLTMMRYVLRFYGFPPALQAVIHPGSWAGSPPNKQSWEDKRIVKLADIMAWSMFFYHPLEHIAFAQWKMPKLLRRVDGNKLSAVSCRFWLVYIFADWISSYLKNCELQKYKTLLLSKEEDASSELEINQIEKCIKMNKLQMVRNFFFAPPCFTWSLNKWATDPLLSENIVNGMSWAEAIVCLYQSLLSL